MLVIHHQSVCFIEDTLRAGPSGVQNILFTRHPTSRLFGDADLGYGTALPARWAEDAEIGLPEKLAVCIHGHAHQHLPVHYANEYGILTVSNTIGYYQEEFKPDSPAGQQQIKDGLPFLMRCLKTEWSRYSACPKISTGTKARYLIDNII